MIADLLVLTLAVGSLFGMAALLFHLVTGITARTISAWRKTPPSMTVGTATLHILGILLLGVVFLTLRGNYLRELPEQATWPMMMFFRSLVLKLTILGFLKLSLTLSIIFGLLPLLLLLARVWHRPWFDRMLGLGLKYLPKSLPLVIYYLLLILSISLATNRHAITASPGDIPWEHLGDGIRQDLTNQFVEVRNMIIRLLDS